MFNPLKRHKSFIVDRPNQRAKIPNEITPLRIAEPGINKEMSPLDFPVELEATVDVVGVLFVLPLVDVVFAVARARCRKASKELFEPDAPALIENTIPCEQWPVCRQ